MSEHFMFEVGGASIAATTYTAHKPLGLTLVLGSGNDGSQRSSFVTAHALRIAERGVLVVTYDFPFASRGRTDKDLFDVLSACSRAAIVAARQCRPGNGLFVGGKSLAARVAAHVLADGGEEVVGVLGLVALGYPLHPVGHRKERHDAHLARLPVPALFIQGTRDVFGRPDELGPIVTALPEPTEVHAVGGGDHDFSVPRGGSVTQAESDDAIADAIASWMQRAAEGGVGRAPERRRPSHMAERLDMLRRTT